MSENIGIFQRESTTIVHIVQAKSELALYGVANTHITCSRSSLTRQQFIAFGVA